jgi:hypothetical protein
MAMKLSYTLLLSAVLLLFTTGTHAHAGEILELTDATFEHQTQVGTTGTDTTQSTPRTTLAAAAVLHCTALYSEYQVPSRSLPALLPWPDTQPR